MNNRKQQQQRKLVFQHELANQLSTATIVLDNDLRISYLNPAAEALLVRSYNRLVGHKFNELFYHITLNECRLKQLLATGQEFTDSDVTIEFIENYKIRVEVTVSSVLIDNEAHLLLECKQIDQQQQISLEAFQHQQWEAARDLIRGLAHEIKNPLGGLRGAAQLLEKELDAEQKEFTQLIISQADRLTNLVDKLLGPNQLPIMAAQNIHQLIENVCQLCQFNEGKNVTFKRDYDPSIPELVIDKDKITQVLLNIVSNAIQVSTGSANIKISTRVGSNITINGQRFRLVAKIAIQDDGPGIPVEIQDTLFYPMVSARANGTGLGLSIAQTLINQHQGKISCTSRPGYTKFTIILPIESES